MKVNNGANIASKSECLTGSLLKFINDDDKMALSEKYLSKKFIAIMQDEELRGCVDTYFANNLNISETSKNSFMHRNTVLYKIDKVHKATGLNVRNFEDAVEFKMLEALYDKTKNLG